jgi:ubiquinone/menaquinone biosynthesis C-methylase UbiE
MDKAIENGEKLTLRINELFHDFEKDAYQEAHPEIFVKEIDRWRTAAEKFFDLKKSVTVIDIGSGTGFVSMAIADLLSSDSTFVCSDISRGILEVAEKNIKGKKFQCNFKFIKIEGKTPFNLPFDDKTADVITINSVLHHIENTENFLYEIDRVLKPGGLILIGHEPNKYFYKNKFLYFQDYILYALLNPKVVFKKIFNLEKGGNFEMIAEKINRVLLKENLIKTSLSEIEINKIVDIKSLIGFEPNNLFPNYKILDLQTYNHVYRISSKYQNNKLIKIYEKILINRYPKSGQIFFVVFKKPNN